MADEPVGPRGGPVGVEGTETDSQVSALAELALCENLAQTSGWAARWSAAKTGADATLLWAPDTVHPLFLCIGAEGEGVQKFLRRSAPRDTGTIHDLVRDRQPIVLTGEELKSNDPFVRGLPGYRACIAVPLEAEGLVVGLLAIFFNEMPNAEHALSRLEHFLEQAAPALGRALRSERKTVGMLHAIERLTNLYDLSKAFGSTIDVDELSELIVRKAADIVTGEAACLWILEGEDDVTVAAAVTNDNYDVESPPDHVGSEIVGDVIADQTTVRRNRIPESDPIFTEHALYPVRSILAAPLVEDDLSIGALVVANKRGRHPEFSAEDEELLHDIARQAVRALRVARQHEAEKKVEELDALLAVSREITATLDLDKVMQTIVNATAALVSYDRCAIAIQAKGRLRLGAISGAAEIDRKDAGVRRMEELLQWVYLSGTDAMVTQTEDGELSADRPETEEKFRAIFAETGLRSFYGVLLKDEEGKLGAIGFESQEAFIFDEETQDLLSILVNQATVAVRNAQLYQEVPLAGFWAPLLEKRRKLQGIPRRRRQSWLIGTLAAVLALVVLPWPLRVEGPARVLPGRRASVTAGVEGVVREVRHREGDLVAAGEVIAVLKDESHQASVAEAKAALGIAQSDIARHTQAGEPGAMFEARSRRDEAAARLAFETEQLGKTVLRAPIAGILVTPHIEQRVGQVLPAGAELAVVADVATVTAEVAVPEADSALLKPGQPVALKMNPFPTRVFRGEVQRVGAALRQEGEQSFLIAEARVENPSNTLRAGMLGEGKVSVGRRRLGAVLFRKPLRYVWLKLWPLLP